MISSAHSSASKVGLYLAKVLMPLIYVERLIASVLIRFGLSTNLVHASKLLLRTMLVVFALIYSWMLVVPIVGFALVAYMLAGGIERNPSIGSSLNTALQQCDYNGSYREGSEGYGYYDNMGLKIHD